MTRFSRLWGHKLSFRSFLLLLRPLSWLSCLVRLCGGLSIALKMLGAPWAL